MANRGYSPEGIIGKFREADLWLSKGLTARENRLEDQHF